MNISYLNLFLKFLRFGFLAWGGPVAQIAMIRQELVEEEKWITPERFNRVLAVYQALPGPEAHELCVYFGMIARGRIGALLAGLGFMTPGFLLMFTLSWFYVNYGITSSIFQSVFLGMQPAVAALIVRAIHRIGSHALHQNKWLWTIAILAFTAQLLDVNFLITLLISGFIFTFATRQNQRFAFVLILVSVSISIYFLFNIFPEIQIIPDSQFTSTNSPNLLILFFSGLRAGLLTFGGAYTAIPFIQHDAVEVGRWMTNPQFLDGLALSGLLPAPLIIFSTFVGYLGGGAIGAILMTIGVFAPAFSFTIIGHDYLEKLVENKSAHAFLDGVTAGVVGLISATALNILFQTIKDIPALIIFILALAVLFLSKSKWTVAWVVLGAGIIGLLLMSF